ncbi:MAG: hypothetical protein J6X55_06020 [Victivallales bacterium]|nr:hypothetical protein [Victivallales bacterium]
MMAKNDCFTAFAERPADLEQRRPHLIQRINRRHGEQKQHDAAQRSPDAGGTHEDGQDHADENQPEASLKNDEQRHPEERALRGRVPEEDFAEEGLHCVQFICKPQNAPCWCDAALANAASMCLVTLLSFPLSLRWIA